MEKTIIEVNGIKLEVDLRTATRIDQFKVGDKVKVLKKQYSDSWNSHLGVIAGFDAFKERPTIIVAYITTGYSGTLEFAYINKDSKDIEIAAAQDFDITYERADIVAQFDKQITQKQNEIKDIEQKKNYFIEKFGKHFEN